MKSRRGDRKVTGPPRPEFPRGLVVFLAGAAFLLSFLSFLASNDSPASADIPTQVVVVTDQGDDTSLVVSKDPVKNQWDALVSRDYDDFEDVATGRFYRDGASPAALDLLESLDPDQFRSLRRGRGWVMVEAPFNGRRAGTGTAILRFVQKDNGWKLEHLRVTNKEQ